MEQNKYCIKEGFVLRQIVDEYTVIPTNEECIVSNAVMTLNESAAFIWKAFQQPSSIQEVVMKGLEEFDVSEEQITKDVEHFVRESLELKIMEEKNNEKEL